MLPLSQRQSQQQFDAMVDDMFPVPTRENSCLKDLTRKYPSVFALKTEPLTITYVRLKDNKHIHKKPYLIPVKYYMEIEKQLQDLEAQGIMQPSASPYSAPLVPLAKKDGGVRLSEH